MIKTKALGAHSHFVGKEKFTTETREKKRLHRGINLLFCESKKEGLRRELRHDF